MNNNQEHDFEDNVLSWDEKYDFEISDLITAARHRMGWTQSRLAEEIGTKQPSIARVESGASLASHSMLKKIAKAINTELLPPRFSFMNEEFSASGTTSQPSVGRADLIYWNAEVRPVSKVSGMFSVNNVVPLTKEFSLTTYKTYSV